MGRLDPGSDRFSPGGLREDRQSIPESTRLIYGRFHLSRPRPDFTHCSNRASKRSRQSRFFPGDGRRYVHPGRAQNDDTRRPDRRLSDQGVQTRRYLYLIIIQILNIH